MVKNNDKKESFLKRNFNNGNKFTNFVLSLLLTIIISYFGWLTSEILSMKNWQMSIVNLTAQDKEKLNGICEKFEEIKDEIKIINQKLYELNKSKNGTQNSN